MKVVHMQAVRGAIVLLIEEGNDDLRRLRSRD